MSKIRVIATGEILNDVWAMLDENNKLKCLATVENRNGAIYIVKKFQPKELELIEL